MHITADAHVHWYPFYDAARFLEVASRHLAVLAGGGPGLRVLFLTERHDCHQFDGLLDGSIVPPAGWTVEPCGEEVSLELRHPAHDPILLLAGRQVITDERIEVLCLGVRSASPDGTPARQVVDACTRMGGFPVLPWSPGKWTGRRGGVVRALVEDPRLNLGIGDPSHRPLGWPEPAPMAKARALRRLVLAGSDPLPFPGEEFSVARYGLCLEAECDPRSLWRTLRPCFQLGDVAIRTAGRRDSAMRFLRRQIALRRHRVAPADDPHPNPAPSPGPPSSIQPPTSGL